MIRYNKAILFICFILVTTSCTKEVVVKPNDPAASMPNDTRITGVVDCNGVAGGDTVKVYYENGALIETKLTNPGGGFSFVVPYSTNLTVEISNSSSHRTINLTSGVEGSVKDLGNINLCDSYFFTQVAAGGKHCMALRSDGTIWAWGDNSHGQLGKDSVIIDTTLAILNSTSIPVQVGQDSGWVKIAAGFNFSLGLKSDGTLWAWGQDNKGQIGNGSSSSADQREPMQISTDSWLQIAAGTEHALAIRSDGTIWAWGDNSYGQLGVGSLSPASINSPVQIGTLSNWNFITAKGANSGAINSSGELWLWGNNERGQTCSYNDPPCSFIAGHYSPVKSPTKEITNQTWLTASAGSCMIGVTSSNQLFGGGDNVNGQLNHVVINVVNVNTDPLGPCNFYFYADQLTTLPGWCKVSHGHGQFWNPGSPNQKNGHTMALRTDGTLWTAGNDYWGHLGNGGYFNQLLTRVGTDSDWSDIDAGAGTSIMLKTNGTVWAMGRNDKGQIGIGIVSATGIPNPSRVLFN